MPLNDDNHQVAEIIKDLESRVTDLEESAQSDERPSLILLSHEQLAIGDDLEGVRERPIEPLRWGDDATGWKTSSWGDPDA